MFSKHKRDGWGYVVELINFRLGVIAIKTRILCSVFGGFHKFNTRFVTPFFGF